MGSLPSGPLLCCNLCLQASSSQGPARSSSPSLTLSRSREASELARTQQAAGPGLQQWSCGKSLDQLHHTVSSSVATWLTFKRRGPIGTAAPLWEGGGDGKGIEGAVLFLDPGVGYLLGFQKFTAFHDLGTFLFAYCTSVKRCCCCRCVFEGSEEHAQWPTVARPQNTTLLFLSPSRRWPTIFLLPCSHHHAICTSLISWLKLNAVWSLLHPPQKQRPDVCPAPTLCSLGLQGSI